MNLRRNFPTPENPCPPLSIDIIEPNELPPTGMLKFFVACLPNLRLTIDASIIGPANPNKPLVIDLRFIPEPLNF